MTYSLPAGKLYTRYHGWTSGLRPANNAEILHARWLYTRLALIALTFGTDNDPFSLVYQAGLPARGVTSIDTYLDALVSRYYFDYYAPN